MVIEIYILVAFKSRMQGRDSLEQTRETNVIFYVSVLHYIIFSCRNIEGRDRTDEYKHHNHGTNFDIFIAVSTKVLWSLKSTF